MKPICNVFAHIICELFLCTNGDNGYYGQVGWGGEGAVHFIVHTAYPGVDIQQPLQRQVASWVFKLLDVGW